jgi:bla regulator protein blaR1
VTAFWLDNLLAYCLQLTALVGSGAAIAWAVRLRSPRVSLRFWQSVALAAVALPAVQSWSERSRPLLPSPIAFATESLASAAISAGWPSPPVILAGILGVGVVLRVAWLALGFITLRRFEAQSEPFVESEALFANMRHSLGATARLRISDDVEGPATIGYRDPLVLLPRRVLDLPSSVQRAIVCHELLHVRRHDWVQALAEEVVCAAFWFHPAVRVLASRLNLSREMLVDELTIAYTRDRRSYAEALLAFADGKPAALVAVAPLIRRRYLSQRIALVLQEVPMSRTRIALACACAFVVVASTTAAAVDRFPISTSLAAQSADAPQKPGDGVTLPKVLREVRPDYTSAALAAKIQGSVMMSIVVLAGGTVGDVTVIQSLDREFGLDDQAVKAVRQWTFEPGKKDGKPVPVQVTVEMTFTLKK